MCVCVCVCLKLYINRHISDIYGIQFRSNFNLYEYIRNLPSGIRARMRVDFDL